MMDWEHRVLIFWIGCHGILLWRLWSQKLIRLYPFLAVFLGAEALQNIALFSIRRHSTLYGWTYVGSNPILWIVAYLIVLDLYRLILEDYPGIASVGRKAVTWCMGMAILISFAYAIPDLKNSTGPFPILRIYYIVERSTVLGLLLFLVLVQLFLVRYKLRLSPNRRIYATGYALYFGIAVAEDVIFTSLGIRVVNSVGLWITVTDGLILLAGAVLLGNKGEVAVQLEPDTGTERAHLQQQLADINRMLSRAARGRG
jgi:hypothetical protein